MLSLIAASIDPTQCLEKGWFCPTRITGYVCADIPGYCDSLYKTGYWTGYADSIKEAPAWNISPLYYIDAFDWTVLIIYFSILTVLLVRTLSGLTWARQCRAHDRIHGCPQPHSTGRRTAAA